MTPILCNKIEIQYCFNESYFNKYSECICFKALACFSIFAALSSWVIIGRFFASSKSIVSIKEKGGVLRVVMVFTEFFKVKRNVFRDRSIFWYIQSSIHMEWTLSRFLLMNWNILWAHWGFWIWKYLYWDYHGVRKNRLTFVWLVLWFYLISFLLESIYHIVSLYFFEVKFIHQTLGKSQ